MTRTPKGINPVKKPLAQIKPPNLQVIAQFMGRAGEDNLPLGNMYARSVTLSVSRTL